MPTSQVILMSETCSENKNKTRRKRKYDEQKTHQSGGQLKRDRKSVTEKAYPRNSKNIDPNHQSFRPPDVTWRKRDVNKNDTKSNSVPSLPVPTEPSPLRDVLRDRAKNDVLFDINKISHPYPESNQRLFWDTTDFLLLPYCLREESQGSIENTRYWNLVTNSMRRTISTSTELEDAIKTYKISGEFHLLHAYAKKYPDESKHFFGAILPKMQEMLINLPKELTRPPKLLKRNKPFEVFLTQKQCAHLLVASFFCTLGGNAQGRANFDRLFQTNVSVS